MSVSGSTSKSHLMGSSSALSLHELDDFKELLQHISPSSLSGIAKRVRGVPNQECTVSEEPLNGSYNLVYVLRFLDDTEWVARIPSNGTRDKFNKEDAESLLNQAYVLQFIKSRTKIPVPEVYHVDASLDNALGAPFVLMQRLPGYTVRDLWYDTEGCTPLKERRERIMRGIADAMTQLRAFSFSEIGKVVFQKNMDISQAQLKPMVVTKGYFVQEIEKFEIGPFRDTKEYYHTAIRTSWDTQEVREARCAAAGLHGPPDYTVSGQRAALDMIINVLPTDDGRGFVLTHPDFDKHNMLALENGTITGILDWDGIAAVPRGSGYARYPTWLIQDFIPSNYQWVDPTTNPGSMEDSPLALRSLRGFYHTAIAQLSEEDALDNMNSHVVDAIALASSDEVHGVQIVGGFMNRCFRDMPFEIDYLRKLRLEAESLSHESKEMGTPYDDETSFQFEFTRNPVRKDEKDEDFSVQQVKRSNPDHTSWYGNWSLPGMISLWYTTLASITSRTLQTPRNTFGKRRTTLHRESKKSSKCTECAAGVDAGLEPIFNTDANGSSPGSIRPLKNGPAAEGSTMNSTGEETGEDLTDEDIVLFSWYFEVYRGLALGLLHNDHVGILQSRFRDMFDPERGFE